MSQTIKTYKDLCEERERLQVQLVAKKQRVKDDWRDLKSELDPVKSAFGLVGKITHPDRSNPLVNAGLKLASDVFLKNFILAKAGWATRLAVPFVVKNFSSHMLVEKGAGIFEKVSNLFKKKKAYNQPYKPYVMNDKDNKVVNTEEQNRAVNPGAADFSESSFKENVGTNQGLTDASQENSRVKPETAQRAED